MEPSFTILNRMSVRLILTPCTHEGYGFASHSVFFCLWTTIASHRCKCSSSILFCGDDTATLVWNAYHPTDFLENFLILAWILSSFSEGNTCCIFLYCLNWNLLLKTFSLFVNCITCVGLIHWEIFVWICDVTSFTNCIQHVYHIEIHIMTAF